MENFNAMAKDFDTDRRIHRAKIISDKIRTHIAGGHKKSAMEYGCGTGLIGLQFVDDFNTLLLIDSSHEMINQVQQKLKNLNNPMISAICCDLCCDLLEGTAEIPPVDYIFSSLVLHHIQNTEAILRRFYDMLNKGGHLLIVDLNADDGSFHAEYPDFEGHNGFAHSTLIALAQKAGFKNTNIETFYHDSKVYKGKENPYSLFILDAAK